MAASGGQDLRGESQTRDVWGDPRGVHGLGATQVCPWASEDVRSVDRRLLLSVELVRLDSNYDGSSGNPNANNLNSIH